MLNLLAQTGLINATGGAPIAALIGILISALGGTIWMILTGRLVPRSTHQDVRDDRDRWHAAHDTSEKARELQGAQLEQLLRASEASTAALTAMQQRFGPQQRGRTG